MGGLGCAPAWKSQPPASADLGMLMRAEARERRFLGAKVCSRRGRRAVQPVQSPSRSKAGGTPSLVAAMLRAVFDQTETPPSLRAIEGFPQPQSTRLTHVANPARCGRRARHPRHPPSARAARRSACGGWPKARTNARRMRSGSPKPDEAAMVSIGAARFRRDRGLLRLAVLDGARRRDAGLFGETRAKWRGLMPPARRGARPSAIAQPFASPAEQRAESSIGPLHLEKRGELRLAARPAAIDHELRAVCRATASPRSSAISANANRFQPSCRPNSTLGHRGRKCGRVRGAPRKAWRRVGCCSDGSWRAGRRGGRPPRG